MKSDKTVSGIIAVLGTLVNYLWGGWDMALRTLFFIYGLRLCSRSYMWI